MLQLNNVQEKISYQYYPFVLAYLLSEKYGQYFQSIQKRESIANSPEQYGYIKSIINDLHQPCYFKTVNRIDNIFYSNAKLIELFDVADTKIFVDTHNEDYGTLALRLHQVKTEIEELERLAIHHKEDVKDRRLPVYVNSSGKILIISLSITRMADENGSVTGILCHFKDITGQISSSEILKLYYANNSDKKIAINRFLNHIGLVNVFSNPNDCLTKRELDCLIKLAEGKTAKETANVMFISHRTVETHLENIKLKFGVRKKHEILSLFKTYFI